MPSTHQSSQRYDERGQASVEVVILLPILALFFAGIVAATRLAYTHLALITVANDCATNGAQAAVMHAGAAGNQGTTAARDAQSMFNAGAPLKWAAAGSGPRASLLCGASLVVWGPPTDYTVRYDFRMPLQPYKSDWEAAP